MAEAVVEADAGEDVREGDGVRGGADPDADGVVWVDATPFRAHLAHVMAVGDMTVDVVAAMTGVPLRAARHLLHGRGGRPVRRISADNGRRLLRVTSFDARTVRQRLVSCRGVVQQLREMEETGRTLAEVAARAGIDLDLLRDLTERRRDVCSPLIAAQVAALHTALDVGDDLSYPLAS